jgi:hypothetical protein
MFPRRLVVLAAALALASTLSSCGGDDDNAMPEMADNMNEMADMADMNMGDQTLTRADQIEGAELVAGDFVLLDTRPQGFDDTAGTAWLARHPGGTTVTVELAGLLPNTDYISHVHADTCANNGGDHYQFDVGGSEFPPNEIHLAFTSDTEGNGFMTAENDRIAGPDAVAFVVHPRELIDNYIVCADFAAQ